MSGDGSNLLVFATGKKRQGKSHELAKIAAKFPRRIIFDFVGEFYNKIPGAIQVRTLSDAAKALKEARKQKRWTLLCIFSPSDAVKLLGAIAPVGGIPEESYSYAVGGIALECGECDKVWMNNAGISDEARDMIQRGRHFRISPLLGTQRPRDTHIVVTSQADVILAFRQKHPRDVEFLGEIMRHDVPALAVTLQPREHLRYFDGANTIERVDEHGTPTLIPEP